MPSQEDPTSQINVIPTNGDEITYTQNPFWQLDCNPLRLQRKYTEIIKSHSRGSMTAYKFCSSHLQGCLSLPLSSSCHPDYSKDTYTAVSLLNDTSISYSATVTADIHMEQILLLE